jgi:filamentous hemagglutinin
LHKGGGTLLGGQVGANPNLSGRTASLILNEVTRTGNAFASRLAGPLEVFGAPAALVIANPNGITCAGCGFVNTAQLTLTTGLPQFLNAPGGAASSFESAAALGLTLSKLGGSFCLASYPSGAV